MKRLIGNEIRAFLKDSDYCQGAIFGLLVDVTEESIYIQCLNPQDQEITIIPKENLKYCTTRSFPVSDKIISKAEPVLICNTNTKQEQLLDPEIAQEIPSCIKVFINEEHFVDIPVPPTFSLASWNDNILRVVLGNPDVKAVIHGKVQKSIEYWPGEVYIEITEEVLVEDPVVEDQTSIGQNTFSMSGGDMITQFLNPAQMAIKLSSMKKGNKNGNETKM